jgi:hypothetical protein
LRVEGLGLTLSVLALDRDGEEGIRTTVSIDMRDSVEDDLKKGFRV